MTLYVIGDGGVFSPTNVLTDVRNSFLDAARDVVSSISHAFDYVWKVRLAVFRVLSGITYTNVNIPIIASLLL